MNLISDVNVTVCYSHNISKSLFTWSNKYSKIPGIQKMTESVRAMSQS